jgi:hypothetical protein
VVRGAEDGNQGNVQRGGHVHQARVVGNEQAAQSDEGQCFFKSGGSGKVYEIGFGGHGADLLPQFPFPGTPEDQSPGPVLPGKTKGQLGKTPGVPAFSRSEGSARVEPEAEGRPGDVSGGKDFQGPFGFRGPCRKNQSTVRAGDAKTCENLKVVFHPVETQDLPLGPDPVREQQAAAVRAQTGTVGDAGNIAYVRGLKCALKKDGAIEPFPLQVCGQAVFSHEPFMPVPGVIRQQAVDVGAGFQQRKHPGFGQHGDGSPGKAFPDRLDRRG